MTLYLNGTTGVSGVDGSAGTPAIQGTDTNTGISFPAADTIAFNEGGAEVGRFDSSGRLLVGTSTALVAGGALTPAFQIAGGDQNSCTQVIRGAGSLQPSLAFTRSNGSIASPTAVTSGDGLGGILFEGHDGSNPIRAALITAAVDGTPGSSDMPGRLVFSTTADGASSPTERMRITNDGKLLVGTTTTGAFHILNRPSASEGNAVLYVGYALYGSANFFECNSGFYSASATAIQVCKNTSTNRSINAGGTVNASGADYAEYMVKTGNFAIAKGDICGVEASGKLTNVFADSISFLVKSTDPSYVGGDTWGTEDVVGPRPSEDEPEQLAAWEALLEEKRQMVDRIAFAGQVPVNVLNAVPGQYIVPAEAADGGIKGVAKNEADLTLAEYMRAIGKVIAIEDDGRARIIVKVA